MHKPRLIFSSALASIITILFVVVITIWAELSAPLKNWLANFSGHHWTTKSIFSLIVYGIVTLLTYSTFRGRKDDLLHWVLGCLIITTVFGVIALAAFYTGHHFGFF